MAKCDVKACGLSLGIVWSVAVFLTGMASFLFNWGGAFVNLFSSFYIGYHATFPGSVIGAFWGFADGFIGGISLAWIYNKFTK